jgi:hypothetical protein
MALPKTSAGKRLRAKMVQAKPARLTFEKTAQQKLENRF